MTKGRIIRPKSVVLSDSAILPEKNLIKPRPNQFTHELSQAQPYYYSRPEGEAAPDGELPEGAQLVLMVYEGGPYCRVVDSQGLYVETKYAGLRPCRK